MSLQIKLTALAAGMGADVKALTAAQGDLTKLPTAAKDNLVAAISEIFGLLATAGAQIDDAAVAGDKDVVFSADKVISTVAEAAAAVKTDILGGAGEAYDTLKELQDLLQAENDAVAALTTSVGNRVRFDAVQNLSAEQKATARTNIGAVSAEAIGDTETDFLAAYNAAKA